jgi:hypothetical protein
MPSVTRTTVFGLIAALLFVGLAVVVRATQASSEPPSPQTSWQSDEEAVAPQLFAGMWDYNDDESVNAATGRREQAVQSATQRGAGSRALPGRPAGSGRGGDGSGSIGRVGGSGPMRIPALERVDPLGPTPEMIRANRSASRDLLEVPEGLTIAVSDDSVTFVDDLMRQRTYPTDGRKQRYQLGAARFDARVTWVGARLRKDIEAAYGLKMTETYFLSPDARRLFVIVRVGEPRPGAPVVGANRVYDRVD